MRIPALTALHRRRSVAALGCAAAAADDGWYLMRHTSQSATALPFQIGTGAVTGMSRSAVVYLKGNAPASGAWQARQFVLDVPSDATDLVLQVGLIGKGSVWVDNLTLAAAGDVPVTASRRLNRYTDNLGNPNVPNPTNIPPELGPESGPAAPL
jgi:hypothetical protein